LWRLQTLCRTQTTHSRRARTDEIFGEVISTYTDAQAPRTAICNILVKYVRMYGFDHKRTAGQFEIAWNELYLDLADLQSKNKPSGRGQCNLASSLMTTRE